MDTVNRVQILYEAIHIPHRANALWKNMDPIILLWAMSN